MKLQAETFGWIARMPPILEDHVTIIESSRKEAEEGLKVCMSIKITWQADAQIFFVLLLL